MRVGVIRGDIPGPLFVADLESTSQTNFPTEPEGQTRYLSRPTAVTVGAMMAVNIPASLQSSALVFPLTITLGVDDTLKIKDSVAGGYTTFTIPAAAYPTMAALVAALNTTFGTANFTAIAGSAVRLWIQTNTAGAGSYIQLDSVAGGSTATAVLGFPIGGTSWTVPTAAAYLVTVLPVGGPLDVSSNTIRSTLGLGLTPTQVTAAADAIAPQFVETDVAIKSFLVGELAGMRSASFNPDPNRIPPIASGPAISVVEDDGATLFSVGNTLPTITNAQVNVPAPGAVTITGTGLASTGAPNAEDLLTKVKFLLPVPVTRQQFTITSVAGGKVSETQIIIPASLVPAGVVAGVRVQVQYTSLVSNVFTLV
jgi:hypothetical protein